MMRTSGSSGRWLAAGAALSWCWPALAQTATPGQATPEAATPTGAATPIQDATPTGETDDSGGDIIVTGSRIRRDPNDSSLPLQIITTQEIARNGISSSEQLLSFLTTNGSGADNLASNADVVSGQQRGNNGASFANLRGQGATGTLVLLNGRRVAAHGQNGAAVDVNQIPFSAIERVEVLKDGASAIYGTDAIGGVINFITRKDYRGLGLQAFTDITDEGDAPIHRLSAIVGHGDLGDQGFNVMGAVSYAKAASLTGDRRGFVDTFQPERGLSPDTRGTPFGTIFPLAGTIIPSAAAAPFIPGTTIRADGGINLLDLPGGGGCESVSDQGPYAEDLWAVPGARFACAWDTGRAAVLQQPLETLTYLGRGVARLGEHEVSLELTGSDATAIKRFSNLQLIPNTTTQNFAYPQTAGSAASYNAVFDRLAAAFPTLEPRRGLPIAYRWRCVECGPREIRTETQTFRAALGLDGPIAWGWDYRAGASYASSTSRSALGSGYYYRDGPTGLIAALNTGAINPFLFPGQSQGQAGRDLLAQASAEGVILYGGQYEVEQLDYSASGPLFRLPGGVVRAAVGVDFRREEYRFNGDVREALARPVIIAAPFDDGNALTGVSREVNAAYAEILVPVLDSLEVTGAIRVDDYSDFGSTTNPKVSIKFRPVEPLMLRASYNTGFRVPGFNQLYNGRTEAVYTGADLADPRTCPGGVPAAGVPGCAAIRPNTVVRGNPLLGPETSEQYSVGVVFQPSSRFSASLDFWSIDRDATIQLLTVRQLVANYDLIPERFIRDAGGAIVTIDQPWGNTGAFRTQGLEVAVRGAVDLAGGQVAAGIDGTYLTRRTEQIVAGGAAVDLIGVFSFSGDLGIRWKHNAFVNYTGDDWGVGLSQLFREGYTNQVLPGVARGAVTPPDVDERVNDYVVYNLSAYVQLTAGLRLTAGVRNLFDTDPPFAISYDSVTGGGSSWEPRVADPRGRSFTLLAEVKF